MPLNTDVILVSPDLIKANTPINDTIDANYLRTSIITCQEKHMQSATGSALYDKICSLVRLGTIGQPANVAYKSLLDQYITPILIWGSLAEYHPFLVAKVDNGGIVNRISQDTTSASALSNEQVRLTWQANMAHYVTLLTRYLCDNSGLFPEYRAPHQLIKPAKAVHAGLKFRIGGGTRYGHDHSLRDT